MSYLHSQNPLLPLWLLTYNSAVLETWYTTVEKVFTTDHCMLYITPSYHVLVLQNVANTCQTGLQITHHDELVSAWQITKHHHVTHIILFLPFLCFHCKPSNTSYLKGSCIFSKGKGAFDYCLYVFSACLSQQQPTLTGELFFFSFSFYACVLVLH